MDLDYNLFIAILMGIVEGLTEFIPVSSTGHLIIAGELLNFRGDTAGAFEVFIQLGAILAVLFLYKDRFVSLLDFRNTSVGLNGFGGCIKIGVTTLPALFFGWLFHGYIKEHLFSTQTVAWALILGGIIFLFVDKINEDKKGASIDEVSLKQCFYIGLFQCLSLWPGVSRAGATVLGGIALGLNRQAAAQYSFLAAVPVMFAAVGYDLIKTDMQFSGSALLFFGVGFLTAFFSALFAIRIFIHLFTYLGFRPFGIYRILFGFIILNFLN